MTIPFSPASDATNFLMRDIAEKIQLRPAEHDLAESRYLAVHKHLEKSGLGPIFPRIYPQGSMAVGTTIASKLDNDEYDIDAVLELAIDAFAYSPGHILDTIFRELRALPGADRVVRQTRCVTVEYVGMHLDVTPAVLIPGQADRTSYIFHSKTDGPAEPERRIIANPWGFAEWFKARTKPEPVFEKSMFRGDMALDPVPEQDGIEEKSNSLLSLQLIKRWRNIVHEERQGRRPPSILLAKLVADNGPGRGGLFDVLQAQATALFREFARVHAEGRLIHVINPACGLDVLSDRWPCDYGQQGIFLGDLHSLCQDLAELRAAPLDLKRKMLNRLFGERSTIRAYESLAKAASADRAAGRLGYKMGSGSAVLGGLGSQAMAHAGIAAPHKFYGGTAKPVR
jgi:hypothetical protein